MQHHDDVGVLRTLPGFRHLAAEDLEIIAGASTLVNCGSATVLVSAGPGNDGIEEPGVDAGVDAGTLTPTPPAGLTASQRALIHRLMHT